MGQFKPLEDELRRNAETFVLSATPERLHALLGNGGDWNVPDLEPFTDLIDDERLATSATFLEAIWIKTGDPHRVFAAVLQPGAAYEFNLSGQYCEMFVMMPWLEKMWADVAPQQQVELMLTVLAEGGSEEADPEFNQVEASFLVAAMCRRMRSKYPPTTAVSAQLVLLEMYAEMDKLLVADPENLDYELDTDKVLMLGVGNLGMLISIEQSSAEQL